MTESEQEASKTKVVQFSNSEDGHVGIISYQ